MSRGPTRTVPSGATAAAASGTPRSPWWILGFLAAVLAVLGASSAAYGRQSPADRPEPRDTAVTSYQAGVAAVVPTRSPGRLLAEPSRLRTLGPADVLPAGAMPDAIAPVSLTLLGRSSSHSLPQPRTRQAPGTGDRAPPSH
jgi:hypothetical protein